MLHALSIYLRYLEVYDGWVSPRFEYNESYYGAFARDANVEHCPGGNVPDLVARIADVHWFWQRRPASDEPVAAVLDASIGPDLALAATSEAKSLRSRSDAQERGRRSRSG